MGHKIWAERILLGGLAPIAIFGSRFAANIILSRLLAPEEFGVAVAINVVLGLGWLATDVALDRFVMIAGTQRAVATAHLLAIGNASLLALIIAIAAPALAVIFGVPQFVESFRMAAVVAIIHGFAHFGLKQIQRNFNYGPEAIAQVTSSIAALGALFIVAVVFRDHRAILASLAVQASIYMMLSHVLARPRYRVILDKKTLRRALAFGLPLTVNGIGLAIMSQLDRVLVGYWFGVAQLASYTVMVSMSLVPATLIGSVISPPSFSFLLSEPSDPASRASRYDLLLACYSVVTGLYACWIALTLDVVTPLVFGRAFAVSPSAHVLLVLIACLRIQRSGAPTTLLLANGQTKKLAALNLSSGLGFLAAAVGVMISPRLETMLLGIAMGDFISCIIFFMQVRAVVARGGSLSGDLLSGLMVPAVMGFVLTLNPAATWEARAILLGVGCVAVSAQLYFEVLRNERLRGIILEVVINRVVRRSARPTEM
jgi:O-antigen/teichoic acid export membrane protein